MNFVLKSIATALFALSIIALTASVSLAASLKSQLVGTWTLVSLVNDVNGTKTEPDGPNPIGYFMYDKSGHFSAQTMVASIPKFASNNKNAGTDAENKAVVQGMTASFGTYRVNEKDHSITSHYIGSSFPNWDGTDQKRLIAIKGDEMTVTLPTGPTGVTGIITLKRLK